jgi:hypothetical protein
LLAPTAVAPPPPPPDVFDTEGGPAPPLFPCGGFTGGVFPLPTVHEVTDPPPDPPGNPSNPQLGADLDPPPPPPAEDIPKPDEALPESP